MGNIEQEVAARAGLEHSEAVEAIATVRQAIAEGRRVRSEELFYRLASRLGIPPARAIEVAQVACHAIAAPLDRHSRRRFLASLPGDVRLLFAAPATAAAPDGGATRLAGAGQTLADGRPGSSHPLSEGRRPPPRTR